MDNKIAEQALDQIERMYIHGDALMKLTAVIRQALSAPRVPAVPDGWKLVPVEPTHELILAGWFYGDICHAVGRPDAFAQAKKNYADLLAASPEPVAQAREVVGITVAEATPDTERCPECGMLDGHAEGCPEYWIDIPANLRRQTNTEQHTQQVIADLRAEVEALRAEKDALIDLSNGLDKMYRKLWKIIAQSVWRLAYRGEKDAVIKELRESIIDAARLREGGGE